MARSRLSSSRGSALVELAVALPVLLLVLAGVGDFARVFYAAMELTSAARAGAQYGGTNLARSAATGAIQSTAVAAAANLSGVVVTATLRCQCANDTGSAFIATSGSANNCTAVVAVSCPTAGTHRVMWVEVTATKTFTTVMRFPGIPNSIALSRSASMRVSE